MKYTNRTGLSSSIADAIIAFAGDYDQMGWHSATTLIDSPRAQLLAKRHDSEISEDVSELLWIFFGNMGHLIAERNASPGSIAERRFILPWQGVDISFKPDLLERDKEDFNIFELNDFKFTSIWALKGALKGQIKIEWERQMNVYVWALRKLGFQVSKIKLQIIARDWRGSEKIREYDYPASPCGVVEIGIWPEAKAEAYVNERIAIYKAAQDLPDDQLPECSQEERWAEPDRWAVCKSDAKVSAGSGYKKAMPKASGFLTRSAAAQFMANREDHAELEIEFRAGESRRCERGYCKAAPFCNQFREKIAPAF